MFVENPKQEVYDAIVKEVSQIWLSVGQVNDVFPFEVLTTFPLFEHTILQRVLVLVSMDVDALCACKILKVRLFFIHDVYRSWRS